MSLKKYDLETFLLLPYEKQEGALCVFFPYKEGRGGPSQALFVSVHGGDIPDVRYAGAYPCEVCGGDFSIVYYADADSHNPCFCPDCYKKIHVLSEFYVGPNAELEGLRSIAEGE